MMIMPKKPDAMSSTERMRKKKEREQAGIVLPDCRQCGAKCTADYTIQNQLCSKCWKKTPEGRKEAIARTMFYRHMQKLTSPEDRAKAIAQLEAQRNAERQKSRINFTEIQECHMNLAAAGVPRKNISTMPS